MRILVPIKQVPETKSVKMDEKTGTVIREGVESIVNPLDLYAIEAAVQLKEQYGAELIGISMGPAKAEKALREAIAMGLDDGILLSDRAFAGSDTWATSYVLAKAIEKVGSVALVICGERATDGDTGQVGPGIAAWLGLPVQTYVSKVGKLQDKMLITERLIENGYEQHEVQLPAVLTVVKEVSEPRLPTLRGKQKAKQMDLRVWQAADIDVEADKIGLDGSPTRVVKISRPKVVRECEKVIAAEKDSVTSAVAALDRFLRRKELL